MEIKEHYDALINVINVKFGQGLYSIEEANVVINALSVITQALNKQPKVEDEPLEEETKPVKKSTKK